MKKSILFKQASKWSTFTSSKSENTINLLGKNRLYGRVDFDNVPVEALTSNFKQCKYGYNIFVLNFVCDAFEDWRDYGINIIKSGRLDANDSFIEILQIENGWRNSSYNYLSLMQTQHKSFVGGLVENSKFRINNFDEYFDIFMSWIFARGYNNLLTKSGWHTSIKNDIFCSGLAFSFMTEKDSKNVASQFYNDKNFKFYDDTLRGFGFLLNKDRPWQIVANLNSPIMQDYMTKRGFLKDKIFEANFKQLWNDDEEELKKFVVASYNSFVRDVPFSYEFDIPCNQRLKVKAIEKPLKNVLELDNNDERFDRLYVYLLLAENGKEINEYDFRKQVDSFRNLKNRNGVVEAVKTLLSISS